jgi:hypothetical protein
MFNPFGVAINNGFISPPVLPVAIHIQALQACGELKKACGKQYKDCIELE